MGGVLIWVPSERAADGLVFITPHVAGSTPVSRQRAAARLVREQAEAYLRGEPLRSVISGAY